MGESGKSLIIFKKVVSLGVHMGLMPSAKKAVARRVLVTLAVIACESSSQ
jgi:hypothetical protein